jgi:hypothetical protein
MPQASKQAEKTEIQETEIDAEASKHAEDTEG